MYVVWLQDKETSIAMIKELRNVLTVRTATKTSMKVKTTRKTKSKHTKKHKLSQNNKISDHLNKEMPEANTSEQYAANKPSDVQQDTNTDITCDTRNKTLYGIKDDKPLTPHGTKESVSRDTEDDLHDTSNNEESSQGLLLMEDTNPMMMRHIATMAARMALKQSAGSNKQEEVFVGSDDHDQ